MHTGAKRLHYCTEVWSILLAEDCLGEYLYIT